VDHFLEIWRVAGEEDRGPRWAFVAFVLLAPTPVVVAARNGDGLSARCEVERCAAQSAILGACPCQPTNGHQRYVRCVAQTLRREGVSRTCRREILKCARHSTCGKRGPVRCLISSTCRIERSAGKCIAEGGLPGPGSSCCPECGTTTTTAGSTTTTGTTPAIARPTTTVPVTTTTASLSTSTTTVLGTTTTTTPGGCHVASDCPVGQSCDTTTHSCTTSCGFALASDCNGGCCNLPATGSGTCVAGDADTQCGNDGSLCEDCVDSCDPGPRCIAGTCGCSSDADCMNDTDNCAPFLNCVAGECS
jgi:hypothetical protein